MKKYISTILIIVILGIFLFLSLSIYSARDLYNQALNQFLISNGLKETESNTFDILKFRTSDLNSYSSDFYVIYYPKDYVISFLEDSLIFYKDLEQIAKLKIINLKSDNPEEFQKVSEDYLFTQDINFDNPMNLPEFYNKYLFNFQNDLIKQGDIFYVSHEEYNTTENELNFKKYVTGFYNRTNSYNFLLLTDPEDDLKNIIMLSDGELLITGYLKMPTAEELNYFVGIIPFINRQLVN